MPTLPGLSGATPYILWDDNVTVLLLVGLLALTLGLSRNDPVRDGRLSPTIQPGNWQ